MSNPCWCSVSTLTSVLFTALPQRLRLLESSEHSQNQKRGRQLDSFLEGPVIVNNVLYLVDILFGRIFAVDLDTKEWALVIQYDGEPNGLAWHKHWNKLVIADFKQGILALDLETRQVSTIMARFNGERLKGPNDLVVAKDGSIIFTDQGMSGLQDPSGRVYCLYLDKRTDVLLCNCPSVNGLVLTADGASIFVTMTRDNSIWVAPIYPDGSVQRTGQFSNYYGVGGPDGLAMDEEGNVFVAHFYVGHDICSLQRWQTTSAGHHGNRWKWHN